jgi:hypothetical protein
VGEDKITKDKDYKEGGMPYKNYANSIRNIQ